MKILFNIQDYILYYSVSINIYFCLKEIIIYIEDLTCSKFLIYSVNFACWNERLATAVAVKFYMSRKLSSLISPRNWNHTWGGISESRMIIVWRCLRHGPVRWLSLSLSLGKRPDTAMYPGMFTCSATCFGRNNDESNSDNTSNSIGSCYRSH